MDETGGGTNPEPAQARTELSLTPSPDGRIRTPNAHGLSPSQIAEVGTVLDAQVAGALAAGPDREGDAFELAALRFEADLAGAAPRGPLERALIGSILLTAEHQRQLLNRAARARTHKSAQRYSALANSAANEVRRGCLALDAMRRPSVRIGSAAQVNVSGGDQAVQNNVQPAPESPTAPQDTHHQKPTQQDPDAA